MLRNAKVGDRVWDIIYGWGNIISVIKNDPFPIAVDFSNGKTISYKFNGKNNDTDINPRLFWDEIKYEIPEKPFNLENELRQLEITEFRHGGNNQFLTWSNEFKNIDSYYFNSFQNPFLIYFTKESIDNFRENIKNKKITKEQFFSAYKKVFGGID